MDPAKQNQIMGYFIEEALEHLTTIENGLLNLESMVTDPEMVNEVFRAAHSIKGGAAMLGISSVQHISHRLEDYFKVIKDNNGLNVDQQLQTLFLQSFDKLKDLLEHLSSPFGLVKEDADAIMADVEPLFAQLKDHLNNLVDGKVTAEVATPSPSRQIIEPITVGRTSGEERAMTLVFQEDIPAKLRDMLQVFKEPDRPTSRQNLQLICDRLYQAGDQFDLKPWCDMLEVVKSAVGNPNNSFRVLAPIVIREVKQAQELVLAHRTEEIVVSSQLQNLLPLESVASLQQEDDISSVFGAIVDEDKSVEQWREFGDRVGWRSDSAWIRTAGINFERSAPVGHLPAPIWLSAWDKSKDSNADEFRDQLHAFMQKLGEC